MYGDWVISIENYHFYGHKTESGWPNKSKLYDWTRWPKMTIWPKIKRSFIDLEYHKCYIHAPICRLMIWPTLRRTYPNIYEHAKIWTYGSLHFSIYSILWLNIQSYGFIFIWSSAFGQWTQHECMCVGKECKTLNI